MELPATFQGNGWDFFGSGDGITDAWEITAGNPPQLWWQNVNSGNIPTFSGGNGTPTNPYLISTAEQLNSIGSNPALMSSSFKISNDIDLVGVATYYPIGSVEFPFQGSLDGNNKTLSNLTINSPAVNYIGLFGYIGGEFLIPLLQFSNLTLSNFNITGNSYVGAFIGYAGLLFASTISNIDIVGGSITGNTQHAGGLAGYAYISIYDSSSSAIVVGQSYTGGLAGFAYSVYNSSSTGAVSGTNNVGGLVGYLDATILNSYSTGSVSGSNNSIGGLVGYIGIGTVQNSYSSGPVLGPYQVGGLVGTSANGDIIESYSTSPVTGIGLSDIIGGLVGLSTSHGSILNCYATGNVNGDDQVGGLVGRFEDEFLSFSYSTGLVTGNTNVEALLAGYIIQLRIWY
jgi:hypothetical protein